MQQSVFAGRFRALLHGDLPALPCTPRSLYAGVMTNNINDLLSRLPVDSIASRLGEDPAKVRQAAEQILPTLLAGMGANAQDPAGRAAARGRATRPACGQHSRTLSGFQRFYLVR